MKDNHPSAIISNVQRFSTEDGPGIRTTVFFKGCPLRCPWCHNPEGLSRRPQLAWREARCIGCGECRKVCPHGAPLPGQSDKCEVCGRCAEACPTIAREIIGRVVTSEKLADEVARDRVFFGEDGGVTASGGEAALHAEFLLRFFDLCRAQHIHIALDTSGAVPGDTFEELLRHVDLVLYDLKLLDEERHREIIGAPLAVILDNLKLLCASGVPFWVRFPVVSGYTDDDDNVRALGLLLQGNKGLKRVDLLPFHQLGRSKYTALGMAYSLSGIAPPPEERLREIREILLKCGLPVSAP